MKKKAYVIGSNVRESLSPFIFNYWFNKAGINNEYNHLISTNKAKYKAAMSVLMDNYRS